MSSNGFFILMTCTVLIFGAQLSQSQEVGVNAIQQQEQDIFFLCKNAKTARWLRAFRLENGKCMTTYSKDGYLQVVSSATHFASCEGVLHNVRKNIEEGGFKCERLNTYTYLELE